MLKLYLAVTDVTHQSPHMHNLFADSNCSQQLKNKVFIGLKIESKLYPRNYDHASGYFKDQCKLYNLPLAPMDGLNN